MIYLDEIKTEKDALDAVEDCEIEAIEASEAISNKRNRIIRAEHNIKMIMKLCKLRRWAQPQKALQYMLDRLGDAKAEFRINLWRS